MRVELEFAESYANCLYSCRMSRRRQTSMELRQEWVILCSNGVPEVLLLTIVSVGTSLGCILHSQLHTSRLLCSFGATCVLRRLRKLGIRCYGCTAIGARDN